MSRPSTSFIQAPLAETIEIGYGSQCWKLDATPSGVTFPARTFSAPEPGANLENLELSISSNS